MRKSCPTCQEDLTEVERLGILADLCWKCQGVWLERGELEEIVRSIRGVTAAPANPSRADERRNIFLYMTRVRRGKDNSNEGA